jgi:hypothetical protein
MSCLNKATEKEKPGGLVKKDKTAKLYRKLTRKTWVPPNGDGWHQPK